MNEHIEIGGSNGGAVAQMRANIDVVEFLGNEELLHVKVGQNDLIAVVDASNRVKPGDVLDMHVALDKVHLFDAESGLALDAPRQAPAGVAAEITV